MVLEEPVGLLAKLRIKQKGVRERHRQCLRAASPLKAPACCRKPKGRTSSNGEKLEANVRI
jgi:hypothetical protein